MASIRNPKVIGNGEKKCGGECGKIKPYSQFYTRPTFGTPEKPATEDGHFITECIACMRKRGKQPKRLEPWISRVKHEQLAIDYFMANGVWATTGKMTNAPDVDLALFGLVWCECKLSSFSKRGHKQSCTFNFTPTQQERGLLAHVVMLMVDRPTGMTYHLFSADDPVFYKDDGVSLKSAIVYTAGKRKISTRGRGYNHQLTEPIMQSAQDNVGLVWRWMKRLQQALCDGERPTYGKPFGR